MGSTSQTIGLPDPQSRLMSGLQNEIAVDVGMTPEAFPLLDAPLSSHRIVLYIHVRSHSAGRQAGIGRVLICIAQCSTAWLQGCGVASYVLGKSDWCRCMLLESQVALRIRTESMHNGKSLTRGRWSQRVRRLHLSLPEDWSLFAWRGCRIIQGAHMCVCIYIAWSTGAQIILWN